jgi:rare lipoprotein A
MKYLALFFCLSCSGAEATASWERFSDAGRTAADGKPFNPSAMTAACRFLELGDVVEVVNPENGLSVVVTITDRCSVRYANRIDLSPAAFKKICPLKKGLCKVLVVKTNQTRRIP